MIDIKKILDERGSVLKFEGVAPEGFVLVHENTLEQLKNMDIWLDWKTGKKTILDLNKKNLDLE